NAGRSRRRDDRDPQARDAGGLRRGARRAGRAAVPRAGRSGGMSREMMGVLRWLAEMEGWLVGEDPLGAHRSTVARLARLGWVQTDTAGFFLTDRGRAAWRTLQTTMRGNPLAAALRAA